MKIKKVSETTPIQAQVVNETSTSTSNAYSCAKVNELVGGGTGGGGRILWQNNAPTSVFGMQNITLNSNDYDMLVFMFSTNTTNSQYISYIVPKGRGVYASWVYNQGFLAREINYVNDTTYQIKANLLNGAESNGLTIPQYVIGYKTGMFVSS